MNKYQIPNCSLISFMGNKVKIQGGINLAQGVPGFNPPIELLEILKQQSFENIHQYAPSDGDFKLTAQILEHYHSFFPFTQDHSLVTTGATEAINLIVLYLKNHISKPFSILAFDPVYESYKNLPGIYQLGLTTCSFDFKGNIDFSSLEKQIRNEKVKLMMIGSPGNPYGKIWSRQELVTLLEICRRNDVFVLFDGVYSEIYFTEETFLPLREFFDHLFYINSFSKRFSITGWRIGYLLADPVCLRGIRRIHDYTGLSSSSLLQRCISLYIEQNEFGKHYSADLRQQVKSSFQLLHNTLIELGFEIPPINGGYFIWAKLPPRFTDGFRFAVDLYDACQVAVVPGIHFSEKGTNFIRINVARSENEIINAIAGIKSFIGNS